MTIHKPTDYVEVYRLKALDPDPNELSGRTGRPELTGFVNRQISGRLRPRAQDTIVDVGCGDASLLRSIAAARPAGNHGELLGVLPTREEVDRVRALLAGEPAASIRIEQGLATAIPAPAAHADKVIVNGVLLLLPAEDAVLRCLAELLRVCKPDGVVYIGEVPDRNEFADRPYGDSITAWLWWLLRTRGPAAAWPRLRQVMGAALGRTPFVILPKTLFFATPESFTALLGQNGFTGIVVERHMELDAAGAVVASPTRWNYLARKK